jgi:hypothetical protein
MVPVVSTVLAVMFALTRTMITVFALKERHGYWEQLSAASWFAAADVS